MWGSAADSSAKVNKGWNKRSNHYNSNKGFKRTNSRTTSTTTTSNGGWGSAATKQSYTDLWNAGNDDNDRGNTSASKSHHDNPVKFGTTTVSYQPSSQTSSFTKPTTTDSQWGVASLFDDSDDEEQVASKTSQKSKKRRQPGKPRDDYSNYE